MHDVRLGLRALQKRLGFTTIAVMTLALGIGANTAVFTIFNAVLLAPLPYERPDEIVMLREATPQFVSGLSVTKFNYDDWRARAQSFASMAAFRTLSMTLTGGDPERVPVKMISAGLLPMLGVPIARGRGFTATDDRAGAERVAIVSAGFARRRFGAEEPTGKPLQLDNNLYTIVGVLPARFELFVPADVYVPLGPWIASLPDDRGWHAGLFPLARLKPNVSIEDARVEMDQIAQQLERQYPEANENVRVLVDRAADLLVQQVRPALLMLQGAVALVLLIACANVANLQLARAVGRQKEIAVRIALGAGRTRVVRQLLVESVVLACAGGLAGLLVAAWGVSFFRGAIQGLPRAATIGVAWPVALFTLGVSVVTGLVFGIAPVVQALRSDIRTGLNEEGRSGLGGVVQRRARAALVIVEVGLALVLLIGAGLLLRSFSALTQVSPGFRPENLLVVNLPLSPQTYAADGARAAAVERIVASVRALPGVERAGMTTALPMSGGGMLIHFNRAALPPKSPSDYVMTGFRAVTPDYLQALDVPLRRGRLLSDRDRDGAPLVAVINETMASQFLPGLDPIGQRVQFGTIPSADDPFMEIVGVVGDMKQSFELGAKPEIFVPYAQHPDPILRATYLNVALVIRTAGEPLATVPSVRAAIREIDAHQPLVSVRTMERSIAGTVAQPRLQMMLLAAFAIVAVTLAAIGVYGVMAYTVSQRLPELGVRIAVGASPNRVIAMVVWQGAQLALIGLAVGFGVALLASRALDGLLFAVSGLDPLTFAVAPVVLALAALLATYIPARRAARVSPLRTLNRTAR